MKILIKHILRNLKENKKRTFMMMLSLIFTSMFITMIICAFNLMSNFSTSLYDEIFSKFDYAVSNKDGSPITKAQEDAVLNDMTKVSRFGNSGYIKVNDKDYIMKIYGTDTTISYKVGFFSQNNGKGIELKENEIIILEKELKDLNLNIGDKITFYNSNGNPYELIIAETIKTDYNLLYEKDQYYTLATNLDTYKKITESEKLENNVYFISFDKQLTEDEKKTFEDKCNEIGLKAINEIDTSDFQLLLDSIIPILAIIILLLIVIVYFVNNSFVKILLNERIPIMGTFRSVGATAKKIDKILLIEMAIYGLISGLIGTIIGLSIIKLLIKFGLIPYFEENITGYDFSFIYKTIDNSTISIFLISIISVTFLQIILSLKDIFSTNKISIKDCIFSKYDDIQKYEIKNLIYGVTFFIIGIISIILKTKINIFFGIIGLILLFISIAKLLPYIYKFIFKYINLKNPVYIMASSNVINSRLQMGSSIILCILMCIIILFISFANIIKEEKIDIENNYKFDSYINIVDSSGTDINDIYFVDGVQSIANLYMTSLGGDGIYLANNKISSFMFYATDNAETLIKTNTKYKNIDAKIFNNLSKNEIILFSDDAKKYGINIGDFIYLNHITKAEKFNVEFPIYLKVVGFHDYSTNAAFISIDLMNELYQLGVIAFSQELFIISENNIDITQNINNMLEERHVTDRAISLAEYIDNSKSELNTVYFVIILACIGLAIIVLICLINNQKVSFIQKKKEFAILNSICMSKKQLKKLITLETMFSYITSAIISIFYSIIMINIISSVINYNLKLNILSIVIIFIIMAIVMYFVSIKTRKNINKINIIDEIKYE